MQWVASPARVGRVDPLDEDAMGPRMGEVSRGRQAVRAEADRIMAPRAAEIASMREHNASVAESYCPATRIASQIEAAETQAPKLKDAKAAKAERYRRQADKWSKQATVADTFR